MTLEEMKNLKNSLIEVCKKQLYASVENLNTEINECQQMANEYGPPKDRYDAFRSQILRKRDLFAQQMAKANHELAFLSSLKTDKIYKTVQLGAIVLSDNMNYFISVSMGNIKSSGKDFMCISPAVPIFKVLSGLKAGDTAQFNKNVIHINDVF